MQAVDIIAPPSKSLSHRTLMAAALARGVSRLDHVLESDDTKCTRDVFSKLGAHFERIDTGVYIVTGLNGRIPSHVESSFSPGRTLAIFVGESGTTCRLATAIIAAGQGLFRIHGSGRMHERPLGDLTATLVSLGSRITFEEKDRCPPLVLEAHGLDAAKTGNGMAIIGSDESSQYLSGLLLAAPLTNGLTIALGGKRVVSWPYVSLTLETLERFGIPFTVKQLTEDNAWRSIDWRAMREAVPGQLRFCVPTGTYKAGNYTIEGDWSGASYFLAAGAIGPKPVRVTGLNARSLQGDAALICILAAMGARLEKNEREITVFPSALHGIDVDMGHCPDLVPTVAALAAHAEGITRIYNAAHLKIKESDRLTAPALELAKVGCAADVTDDGLLIQPSAGGPVAPAPGTLFSAHNDHRMAMSLSLLGLPGLRGSSGFAIPLDEPSCVAKSFPLFWDCWKKILA